MNQPKITSSLKYPHWLKPSKSDRIANIFMCAFCGVAWVTLLASILHG